MSTFVARATTAASVAVGLRVTGLTCRFGGVVAVNELSLQVAPGELVGVVGPNGAGKSTLIQLITGFARAASGAIWLGERRLNRLAPEAIAALGVARTFQTSRVFPALSVWESVLVGNHVALIGDGHARRRMNPLVEIVDALADLPAYRARRREQEAQAEVALRLFGDRLWPRRADPAASLSYANRRRLELARALVSEPSLLLLDEPTAGMNPTETAELAELIARLHQERPQMGTVLVEHKMQVVRRLCTHVVVMNQGSRIAEGSPGDVLEDPRVVEAYLGRRHGPKGAEPLPADASEALSEDVKA